MDGTNDDLYRELFHALPCYVTAQDRDFRIIASNRIFQAEFGHRHGTRCFEAYKGREERCPVCPVQRTFEDGRRHRSEEVLRLEDGTERCVNLCTAPIRDAAGEIVAVVALSADREHKEILGRTAPAVSPAGEIESVMAISTAITDPRQLQSRFTALGMLVGSVSQGIKGLLSGFDGGVYLMETGFDRELEDRVHQGFNMVKRNVDRIRSMVLNILYHAKDREVIWEPIDLEELTSAVEEVLDSRATQLGVKVEVRAEAGELEGDQLAIHALLVNLVENALDACRFDKKQTEHQVLLRASMEGSNVIFEVTDNGIGMDQETKERAFGLSCCSRGAEGSGLGLFIAHKIVKSHFGTIEIDSRLGAGSRVVVKLPRQRPTASQETRCRAAVKG